MKNVMAIIPARGGSKGIPRKNLKKLANKPLVVYSLEHALSSKYINKVILNTDDQEIANIGKLPGVEILMRPHELSTDDAKVDPMLIWTVKQVEKSGKSLDVIVLLYPTSPFRSVSKIDEAIAKVTEGNADSVLSIYEDVTYLWEKVDDTIVPTNYEPKNRGPRHSEGWNQWAENKAIYVMKRDLLMNTGCRLGGKIDYVEMSKIESIDIDDENDLELAYMIANNKFGGAQIY